MKVVAVREPVNLRDALLGQIAAREQSKYGFAVECVKAGICQHHTVDELLSPNASRSPSLSMAIALLDQAGLELVIRPKNGKAPRAGRGSVR